MTLLLTLSLLAFPLQAAQSVDTTQIARLRAQMQMQLLQATQTQAHKIDSLARGVTALRESVRFYERLAGGTVVLLTIVTVTTIWGMVKRATRKLDRTISDKLYRVNPLDMPIKFPESGMEKQLARLRQVEFHDISLYRWLDDSCTRHAVVVLAATDEDAEKLKSFLGNKDLAERDDVAFVVYTKGARINPAILGGFDNVTFANNHLTLVQALFVAARGMVRP